MSLVVKRRKSRPRTKTGCFTCRIRRIKCDEGRPSCNKCLISGRICDAPIDEDEESLQNHNWHFAFGSNFEKSAREQRCFHYFRDRTTSALSGYNIHSRFWHNIVLQISHSSPAIFHAALALGSLQEHLEAGLTFEPRHKSYRFLYQQINKAIRDLCSQGKSLPVQVALVCCVLFICLENAQGNYEAALNHLQSGLNMLEEWCNQSSSGMKAATDEQDILVQTFCKLDIQATTFLDNRPPRIHVNSFNGSPFSIPPSFQTLEDARIALERMEMRALYILTSVHELYSREKLLQGLQDCFSLWEDKFESLSLLEKSSIGRNRLKLGVLLKLHQKTMSVMLKLKTDPLMKHAAHLDSSLEAELSNINSVARLLIASSASSPSAFTAETGIVAPLYFVAMHTRSTYTRNETIELLSACNCKEGFWDPEIVIKIAKMAASAHDEKGMYEARFPGGIPDLVKAHEILTA